MLWPLARTTFLGPWRRAVPVFRENPLFGVIAFSTLILSPLGLWRAGAMMAEPLAPLLATEEAAIPFIATLVVVAALAGAIFASSVPHVGNLSEQIATVPVSAYRLVLAYVVVPTAIVSGLAAIPVGLFLAPVAGEAPAGRAAVIVMLLGLMVTSLASAVVFEALRLANARLSILVLLVTMTTWLVSGAAGGQLPLGVIATIGDSLVRGPRAEHLVVLALAWGVAGLSWLHLLTTQPVRVARRRPTRSRPLRIPELAHFLVTLRVLSRRAPIRRHVLAVVILATTSSVFGILVADLEPAMAVSVGTVVAVLGAVTVPLVVFTIDTEGAWLWGSTPGRVAGRVAGRVGAAAAMAVAVFVVASVPLSLAAGTPPAVAAELGLLLVLMLGPAIATGAIIPFDPTTVVSQAASYSVCGVVSAGWYMATVAILRIIGDNLPTTETSVVAGMAGLGLLFGAVVAHQRLSRMEAR